MNTPMNRQEAIDHLVREVEKAQIAIFASVAANEPAVEAMCRLAVANARPRVTRSYEASFTDAEIAGYARAQADPDFQSFKAKAGQIDAVVSGIILEEANKLS